MEVKVKLHPLLIELNALAVKTLVLSGNFERKRSYFITNIEFSSEELKKFKNNYIFVFQYGEYYVVLLDIKYRKSDKDKIVEFIDNVERFYNIVYRDIDKYSPNSKELIDYVYDKYIGYEVIEKEVEKWFNDYAIKYGKVPSNKEIKEFIIDYVSSYDLKSEIEEILRKAKILRNK